MHTSKFSCIYGVNVIVLRFRPQKRSTDFGFSFPKWTSNVPTVSPRGIKRPLSDISGTENAKIPCWNPDLLESPPKASPKPSKLSSSFTAQPFKRAFPDVAPQQRK